jgi:hypothetical protein
VNLYKRLFSEGSPRNRPAESLSLSSAGTIITSASSSQTSDDMQCQLNATPAARVHQLQSTATSHSPPPPQQSRYKLSFTPNQHRRRNINKETQTQLHSPLPTKLNMPSSSSRTPPPKLIIPSKSDGGDHNEMTPPTTPKSACASTPSSLVASVLSRLSRHHPNLRPPSLSDRAKCLEKATALPDLPEWMWYGLLNYSIRLDSAEEQEVVDFGILDEFLDCEAGEGGVMSNPPGKMWDVLFYYMYLHLESGRGGGVEGAVRGVVPLTPPATEDGESGIEDAGRRELRRVSHSKSSPTAKQEVLPPPQQSQGRGWGARDWVILFLLSLVTVLLALSFAPVNQLQALR